MAIWQDLVTEYGFSGGYESVKRFVRRVRGARRPEAVGTLITAAGEEAQVKSDGARSAKWQVQANPLICHDAWLQSQIGATADIPIHAGWLETN
jgi:hypothetical protein